MGSPCGPDTYDRLISRHVQSMREYADELDDMAAKIDRNSVVARIRKCALEVEACSEAIKDRAKRKAAQDALAAGTRRAETTGSVPKGCQSGPKGNAQNKSGDSHD